MLTTLGTLFCSLFDRERLLQWARELGATQRLREIHPADFTRSLVESALGDEQRSIATARRHYARIASFMPEESAFYQRFNAGLVQLMKRLFTKAVEGCTRVQRECLANVLGGADILDLVTLDASQVALPGRAAEVFPSTSANRGGVKLTAMMSVLNTTVTKITISDARKHDRRALKLPRWLRGTLLLMDRGYCDRKLFATIEDRGGLFLTRLKKSHRPLITRIRSGLPQEHVGSAVAGELPFEGNVDLDAAFAMHDGTIREFRVVRLVVAHQQRGGKLESVELLFVTNLTSAQFSPEQLATLYRLRWEIERLFAVLKGVGRLDHLRSASPHVVEAFLYATLIGVVLAMDVSAWMRQTRPGCEPSLHRVTALVLGYLPRIIATMHRSAFLHTLREFAAALWREGVNPNPGRPFTATLYELDLAWLASGRRASA